MKNINLFRFSGESTAPFMEISAEAETPATMGAGSPVSAETECGEQTAAALQQADELSATQDNYSYKHFKEQFKKEYQADLQRIIDKRFKNAKKVEAQRDALQEQNRQWSPLLEALSKKYQTDDLQVLMSKITQADHPAAAAQNTPSLQEGDSEEPPLESLESERLLKQQEIVENWQKQAVELGELYPEFDLAREVDNEKFAQALQSGMSMRDAYQYAHFDEILSGVIAYTADNVKSAIEADRAARGARPVENGIRSSSAAVVGTDVNKLTKQQMEEIDKRVLRGEKISF